MSLTVWSFALLHGFFVLIVAGLTHSKTAVAFAAIVAAVAGLLVGDPVYIALDLLCVAVATYYCWTDLAKRHQRTPQEIAAAQEKARLERIKAAETAAKRDIAIAEFFKGTVAIIAIGGFLLWKFWEPSVPGKATPNAAVQPQSQLAVAQPVGAAVTHKKVKKVNSVQPPGNTQRNVRKTPTAKKRSVEKCLEIVDEQAMVRCLERAQ